MPARKPPPPAEPALSRDAWCDAFIAEVIRLRPHLGPKYSVSKFSRALAMNNYTGKLDPKVAAQRYHAANPL